MSRTRRRTPRSAAVSKTSRSAWEGRRRRDFAACCGWSRTTQPRSVPKETSSRHTAQHLSQAQPGWLPAKSCCRRKRPRNTRKDLQCREGKPSYSSLRLLRLCGFTQIISVRTRRHFFAREKNVLLTTRPPGVNRRDARNAEKSFQGKVSAFFAPLRFHSDYLRDDPPPIPHSRKERPLNH